MRDVAGGPGGLGEGLGCGGCGLKGVLCITGAIFHCKYTALPLVAHRRAQAG